MPIDVYMPSKGGVYAVVPPGGPPLLRRQTTSFLAACLPQSTHGDHSHTFTGCVLYTQVHVACTHMGAVPPLGSTLAAQTASFMEAGGKHISSSDDAGMTETGPTGLLYAGAGVALCHCQLILMALSVHILGGVA